MKYKLKKKIVEHTCIKFFFEGIRYLSSPNVKIHW